VDNSPTSPSVQPEKPVNIFPRLFAGSATLSHCTNSQARVAAYVPAGHYGAPISHQIERPLNSHDPIRIGVIQRFQQHRPDHCEHGRNAANAQREREDSNGYEPGALARQSCRIHQILSEVLDRGERPGIVCAQAG